MVCVCARARARARARMSVHLDKLHMQSIHEWVHAWGGAVRVLYSCRVGTLLVASLASVVTLRVTRVLVKRRSSAPFFLHTWNSGYGEIDR